MYIAYCSLLCHVCLISLRDLLFSERRWREDGSQGEVSSRDKGRGNFSKDLVYERRIKKI